MEYFFFPHGLHTNAIWCWFFAPKWLKSTTATTNATLSLTPEEATTSKAQLPELPHVKPRGRVHLTPSHGNRQDLHYAACNYQYKRNKTIWWNVRKILPLSHPDRQEGSPDLYANGQLEAFLGNCKEVMPLCKSEGKKKKKRWDRKPRLNSTWV